jgi:molybdopterin synthase catalytic subunit
MGKKSLRKGDQLMNFSLHLFAGLAEVFGTTELTWETDAPSVTAGMLKEGLARQYPQGAQAVKQSFVARNRAYAADDEILAEGDELALIPPVSGGQDLAPSGQRDSGKIRPFAITSDPLSVEAVARHVMHPDHGAVLTFTGTTRGLTGGKRTVRLEYEAYLPMALDCLEKIGAEISAHWPGTLCAIAHRVGTVQVGEASVVIAVSAPHRKGCYDASRYAIERLKQIVPIWKKEISDDGSEWKGSASPGWDPTAECDDSCPKEGSEGE